jgi:hypothetical protein
MTSEREASCSAISSGMPEALIAALLDGMHAVAQPLTILRSSLCEENTRSMGEVEFRKLTVQSADEVERLCSLFSYMQHMLLVESSKPRLESERISTLLLHAIEGMELIFKDAGMLLLCTVPAACPEVLIDRSRTGEALSTVLQVAQSISNTEDTIELVATCSAEAVCVTVSSSRLPVRTLNTEARLRLALVDANIRSQQGKFTWCWQPFSAQIVFLKASIAY